MTKDAVADWDTTADNNTDVGGVNIAENCPPSGLNNAMREMMAQIKAFSVSLGSTGITFADTIPLYFGTGQDVTAVHTGTEFTFTNSTGDTTFFVDDVRVKSLTGENLFSAFTDAGFLAYYNNAEKFRTVTSGIQVTGSVLFVEQASATDPTAGFGKFWVKSDTPNTPQFTDDENSSFELAKLGWSGYPHAQYESRLAQGTDGAAWPTSWTKLALTDERYDNFGLITLTSSQLIFAKAGNYHIDAVMPYYNSSGSARGFALRLQNATAGGTILSGGTTRASDGVNGEVVMRGRFTVANDGDAIEVQGFCTGTGTVNGRAANLSGVTEVFNVVSIWRQVPG